MPLPQRDRRTAGKIFDCGCKTGSTDVMRAAHGPPMGDASSLDSSNSTIEIFAPEDRIRNQTVTGMRSIEWFRWRALVGLVAAARVFFATRRSLTREARPPKREVRWLRVFGGPGAVSAGALLAPSAALPVALLPEYSTAIELSRMGSHAVPARAAAGAATGANRRPCSRAGPPRPAFP